MEGISSRTRFLFLGECVISGYYFQFIGKVLKIEMKESRFFYKWLALNRVVISKIFALFLCFWVRRP